MPVGTAIVPIGTAAEGNPLTYPPGDSPGHYSVHKSRLYTIIRLRKTFLVQVSRHSALWGLSSWDSDTKTVMKSHLIVQARLVHGNDKGVASPFSLVMRRYGPSKAAGKRRWCQSLVLAHRSLAQVSGFLGAGVEKWLRPAPRIGCLCSPLVQVLPPKTHLRQQTWRPVPETRVTCANPTPITSQPSILPQSLLLPYHIPYH